MIFESSKIADLLPSVPTTVHFGSVGARSVRNRNDNGNPIQSTPFIWRENNKLAFTLEISIKGLARAACELSERAMTEKLWMKDARY